VWGRASGLILPHGTLDVELTVLRACDEGAPLLLGALNYETQNHLFLNMHKTTRPQSGFSFDNKVITHS